MRIIITIILYAITHIALALDSLPAAMAFQVSLKQTEAHLVQLEFNLAPGYDVYANRIKISADQMSSFGLGKITLPQPLVIHNQTLGDYKIYTNDFMIPIEIISHNHSGDLLKLKLIFQGCKGDEYCYPAMERTFIMHIQPHVVGSHAEVTTIAHGDGIIADNNITMESRFNFADDLVRHPILSMLGLFVVGLLIAFTPCVFPMFPVLLSIIAGRNNQRAFWLALAYILGGSCVYAATGVIVAYIGIGLQSEMQNIWVASGMALLLIIFSLSLFGVFEIKLPHWLQSKLHYHVNQIGPSLLGVFFIGALSTLILSPCVTAPLAGVLVYISNSHNIIIGGGALFILGLGIGMPLLFIAVVGNRLLPKSGQWMITVKHLLGMIMLLMAVYPLYPYISTTILLTLVGIWFILLSVFIALVLRPVALKFLFAVVIFGAGGMLIVYPYVSHMINMVTKVQNSFNATVTSQQELQPLLKLATAQHKIVLLDYSATWCLACREMELTTWRDPNLQQLMHSTLNVKVDVTQNNDDTKSLEKVYKVFAPPSIIILDSTGHVIKNFMGNTSAQAIIDVLK